MITLRRHRAAVGKRSVDRGRRIQRRGYGDLSLDLPIPKARQDLERFPRTKAWLGQVSSRPAVKRGMELFKDAARETPLDDEAHQKLFGRQGVAQ
jgi:hypothetical protein